MEIPLGTAGSKLYEKDGVMHYRIAPLYGKETTFTLDVPVSDIDVCKKSDGVLLYKNGSYKLKMEFTPKDANIYELSIKPYRFWCIPSSTTACEISKANKESLFDVVSSH